MEGGRGKGRKFLINLTGATSVLLATHPFNIDEIDESDRFIFAGAGGKTNADGVSLSPPRSPPSSPLPFSLP
jgi:hypothetical protein